MPKKNSSVTATAAARSHAIDPASPSPAPDPGRNGSSLPIPASPRELITSNLDTIFNSLKLAGGMVQNVPYIGLVADIMLQILQIRDEVTVFKDKWKDVMNDIKKMRSIVEDYVQTSVQPDGFPSLVLSEDVQGHLRALERLLEDIAQALSRCCPKRKADQLRIILQRRELRSLVDSCKVQLQTELTFFNTRTNLLNNRILQSIRRDVPQNKASSQPIKIKYTLPAKPRIMHGRDDIISELVTAILNGSSARLALLALGALERPLLLSQCCIMIVTDHSISLRLLLRHQGIASVMCSSCPITCSLPHMTWGYPSPMPLFPFGTSYCSPSHCSSFGHHCSHSIVRPVVVSIVLFPLSFQYL